ncbi:MAG: hypothetical protein A07HR60_00666 [uncultured archaeon A07HR60]|nr:MAG: hypothetical protein A07HR60_00666 [uncultured archaeon A07HR60]
MNDDPEGTASADDDSDRAPGSAGQSAEEPDSSDDPAPVQKPDPDADTDDSYTNSGDAPGRQDNRDGGVTGSNPPKADSETGDGTQETTPGNSIPSDVQRYERFTKMDGAQYDRVNEFLRDRTYITAREWAIARLCADFRTETGVEMTKIGENLPELIPFMTDTYTPQAVNQARTSFEEKITQAGATFLYGAMSGFFTAEDLDDVMYEVTEVAKFLLEVEGVDLDVEDELESEDRISAVMRDVRESSQQLRGEEVRCPECGHVHDPGE